MGAPPHLFSAHITGRAPRDLCYVVPTDAFALHFSKAALKAGAFSLSILPAWLASASLVAMSQVFQLPTPNGESAREIRRDVSFSTRVTVQCPQIIDGSEGRISVG